MNKLASKFTGKKQTGDTEIYANTYRRDELSWRAIVFLPFNSSWRLAIAFAGVVYFNIIIYEEIFVMKVNAESGTIIYELLTVITLMFFIDTVLSILHKIWETVQKSMPYQSKRTLVIFIDIISIFPIRMIIGASFLRPDHSINWLQILSMNGCLRVYRVFTEILNWRQRKGTNQTILVLMFTTVLSLSIVSVLCSVYYTIGYVNMSSDNMTSTILKVTSWLDDVKVSTNIDLSEPVQMYKFTILHIYVLLNNETIVDVRQVNYVELIFLCFILYYGYNLRYGLIFSTSINIFLKSHKHIYGMKSYIKINRTCLKDKKKKELESFYNTFWRNWSGLHNCPLLDKFPLCLRKDVLTDVYWDAMSHSHVLRNFGLNIKRELSLVMESKFLQPGDYIFRKNEPKDIYYYIASGVVQIMSHYDGVSPIMTISDGSSLGGLALVLRTTSATDVICASVCEVRILTYKAFYDVLMRYPDGLKILRDTKIEHIGLAKKMFVLSNSLREKNMIMAMYGVPQDDKLKWIKQRWRAMKKLDYDLPDINNKMIKAMEENELKIDITHSSKNLDVIVLSNEVKWEADKCCFHSKWPYVLDPDCNFVKLWLMFICFLITIDCFIVTYRAAFQTRSTETHVMWDHIIFFVYLLDVYLQAITGVVSVDKTITEPMPLLRHHLKNPRYLLDIIAAIPTREVVRLYQNEYFINPQIALIRLCKSLRVFSYFRYRYSLIMSNYLVTHIAKYFYIYFLVLFVSAAAAFMRSCRYHVDVREVRCDAASWYLLAKDLGQIVIPDDFKERERIAQYILKKSSMEAIEFVYRFIFKSGLKDFAPTAMDDILVCSVIVFIANNLFIVIACELIAMQILTKRRKVACEELIFELKSVLAIKNVHMGLLNILDSFLSLQWKVNRAIEQNLEEIPYPEIISPVLEAEQKKIILSYLKSIDFFDNLSPETFANICNAFRLFTVPEDFIFCRSGDQPSSFNIIVNGYCNLTSMIKEDVYAYPNGKIIGPGFSFPFLEVAQNMSCFQTTVSITVCEVATIDVVELRTILSKDKPIADDIKRAIEFNEEDIAIIDSKKKYSKYESKSPNFIPRRVNKLAEEKIKLSKLRRVLKYLYYLWEPPFIINPSGNFIFIWETIKVIQVIVTLLYVPLVYSLICEHYQRPAFILLVLLDFITIFDIFIRFNVGCYNKEGILMHRKMYYISHAFTVDMIASVPIQLMLGGYNVGIKFVIDSAAKSLQVYRVYGYFQSLKRIYNIGSFKVLCLSFFVHWTIFTSIFSNWLFINACEVKCVDNSYKIDCNPSSCLLSNYSFKDKLVPFNLLLISFNIVITIFLGNDQTGFYLPVDATKDEILLVFFFGVISVAAKFFYITAGTSLLVGGGLNFTKHRENMALYWLFVENEGGSKELASTIAKHFTFQYSRLKGIKMNDFIYTLHPSLQSDLTYAIYHKSMLSLKKLVGESRSFMKRLTKKVDEIYYQRDTVILNINEVNDKIFFVREGMVEVLDIGHDCIKTIGPGSMFGSFKILEKTRHQYEFRSHGQTNLIIIGSRMFYQLLRDHGRRYEKKFIKQTRSKEFFFYNPQTAFEKQQIDDLKSDLSVELQKREKLTFFHRNRPWYRWVMFFLSMVVPYLTIFPLLFSMLTPHNTVYVCMIYFFDFISSLRIVLNFISTYADEKTGVYVDDMFRIRVNYIMAPSQFLLDVLSIFPYEVIGFLEQRQWFSILRINRMLKLVIMLMYIQYHSNKIYVRPCFRWFEFVSLVTLVPYILVCFWQYTTCIDGCSVMYQFQTTTVRNPYAMFIHSMRLVINLFTFSPAFDTLKPWTRRECVVMIIISIVSFLVLPAVIGRFTQISQMTNYTQKVYDYNVQCMKVFLQLRDLSASLLQALWDYSFLIWTSDKGEIMPNYVLNAPKNMICELVYDLYGAHIEYNILFENCHHDFIVQLAGRMKRSIYFPGDCIIRSFDVDGRMYFINSGEVDALEFDDLFKEIVKEVYITGQCFGLRQGLYERVGHMSTYKARSMVEILTLAKRDWDDLALTFPEETFNIFKVARKLSLDDLAFMINK